MSMQSSRIGFGTGAQLSKAQREAGIGQEDILKVGAVGSKSYITQDSKGNYYFVSEHGQPRLIKAAEDYGTNQTHRTDQPKPAVVSSGVLSLKSPLLPTKTTASTYKPTYTELLKKQSILPTAYNTSMGLEGSKSYTELLKKQSIVPYTYSQPTEKPRKLQTSQNNPYFFGNISEKITKSSNKTLIASQRESLPYKKTIFGLKSLGLGIIKPYAETAYLGEKLIKHPISTSKELYSSTKDIIKNPLSYGYELGQSIKQNPLYYGGQAITYIGRPEKLAMSTFKKGYIKIGTPLIESEKLIPQKVLQNKATFPTVSSTKEALNLFEETRNINTNILKSDKIKVTHSTINKFPEKTNIKPSPRTYEESGLSVTPLTQTSPYFLRLPKENVPTKYTLNPFKNINQKPNIVLMELDTIKQYPKNILKKSGSKNINLYASTYKDTGTAFIAKKLEIGTGNIRSKNYPAGLEIEAKIPAGSSLVRSTPTISSEIKGFSEYTKINGEYIPIYHYKTVGKSSFKKTLKQNTKFSNELKQLESDNYYYNKDKYNYKTPYNKIFNLNYKSLNYNKSNLSQNYKIKSSPFAYYNNKIKNEDKYKIPYIPVKPIGSYPIHYKPKSPKYKYGGGGHNYSQPSLYFNKSLKGNYPIIPIFPKEKTNKNIKKLNLDKIRIKIENKKETFFSFDQPKKYTPTAYSSFFKIVGSSSKIGTTSGLGLRPIPKKWIK